MVMFLPGENPSQNKLLIGSLKNDERVEAFLFQHMHIQLELLAKPCQFLASEFFKAFRVSERL